MSDTAIRVENVSKTFRLPHEKTTSLKSLVINLGRGRTYEKQQALEDVSFEVKKGEFFGIVGRNGSGKSTLLKMLAGIYSPSRGRIHVDGKLTPFIELGVGFNPELTGRENVFLNGALLGFSRREMARMYDEIVEFAELERFMDQKLKNYSSGMQVRLAFSIAIQAKSNILILDEVLAVGDAAFQQKCFDYFEDLKGQKSTVVFVTHDMDAVRRFCDRAIYIDAGHLTHSGTPQDIADVYLEENIERIRQSGAKTGKDQGAYKIDGEIVRQTAEKIILGINYDSEGKEPLYVGVSIIKNGASVAEINSLEQLQLKGKGRISYTLDTSLLNGGIYQVTAALFKVKGRELVAIGKNKGQFAIKSEDNTRGGALKLDSTWKKEGNTNGS
jgi:ABC-2 type transport system ATP-binding protein